MDLLYLDTHPCLELGSGYWHLLTTLVSRHPCEHWEDISLWIPNVWWLGWMACVQLMKTKALWIFLSFLCNGWRDKLYIGNRNAAYNEVSFNLRGLEDNSSQSLSQQGSGEWRGCDGLSYTWWAYLGFVLLHLLEWIASDPLPQNSFLSTLHATYSKMMVRLPERN